MLAKPHLPAVMMVCIIYFVVLQCSITKIKFVILCIYNNNTAHISIPPQSCKSDQAIAVISFTFLLLCSVIHSFSDNCYSVYMFHIIRRDMSTAV